MINYNSILLTDLYELTMAAGYLKNNYNPVATFELFVRHLPPKRNYLIFAGLEQVLDFVENLKFTEEDIKYLQSQNVFKQISKDFWEYLRNFKFSGEIHSVKEGEIVFAKEPLIRVTAPLIEAQILETFLLTTINFQTAIASKAGRIVTAAKTYGKKYHLMEFGSRRAHGPQAGMLAARAAFIAGFNGTSNVMAGKEFGIPIFGTAAHSWIMAFRDELKSFEAFHITFPESTILLVDTYGTEKGIENAIKVGNKIKGIRIDSGNLLEESIKARKQLDDAGMQNVKIVLSGDLDEYKIKDLIENNSPADSYGVGTRLSVSSDAPYLGGIYKLVQLEQENNTVYTAKFSKNKTTYPGKKQIFRQRDKNGIFSNDIIGLNTEEIEGEKLLYPVFLNGKRTQPKTDLKTIQDYCRKQLAKLPEQLLNLTYVFNVDVKYSSSLNDLLAFLLKKSAEENSLNG